MQHRKNFIFAAIVLALLVSFAVSAGTTSSSSSKASNSSNSTNSANTTDEVVYDFTAFNRSAAYYNGVHYYELLVINKLNTGYDPTTLPLNPVPNSNRSLTNI
jgi:hypothetical protein